jgi:hypothetical protein
LASLPQVSTRSNVIDLAQQTGAVKGMIETRARRCGHLVTARARLLTQKYSSGRYSQKTLDMIGNPYAVSHGPKLGIGLQSKVGLSAKHGKPQASAWALYPSVGPAMINEQTGDFKSKWQVRYQYTLSAGLQISYWNTSPHAKFMEGTGTMIPRPVQSAINAELRPYFLEQVKGILFFG